MSNTFGGDLHGFVCISNYICFSKLNIYNKRKEITGKQCEIWLFVENNLICVELILTNLICTSGEMLNIMFTTNI